jgi:hypothetical protein
MPKEHDIPRKQHQTQTQLSSGLYTAKYERPTDVATTVGGNVTQTIRDDMATAAGANVMNDRELLEATVRTAIHISNMESTSETRVTAIINAAFKAHPDHIATSVRKEENGDTGNAVVSETAQENENGQGDKACTFTTHFTVRALRHEAKEGRLEWLLDKLGFLGHLRTPFDRDFPQEGYDPYEKRLWDAWKSQVDMWQNGQQSCGWHEDVKYWSVVLARFGKGKSQEVKAQKKMVKWGAYTKLLSRVADAAAYSARAGLLPSAEAAEEMKHAALEVVALAQAEELLKGSEDVTIRAIRSIRKEVEEAPERLQDEALVAALAKVVAQVTHKVAERERGGTDESLWATTKASLVRAVRLVEPSQPQEAAIQAMKALASLAKVLSDNLPSAADAQGSPWGGKIVQVQEAVRLFASSVDEGNLKTSMVHADAAKVAAAEATDGLLDAAIRWHLPSVGMEDAVPYMINYP